MDIRTFALHEIDTINRTLANHGVDAGAAPGWTTIAGSAYIVYELHTGRACTVADVAKRLPELAEALSTFRRTATPVRLRTMPLALEVAHPHPAPLRWQTASLALPPATMLAGKSYTGSNQQELVSLDKSVHVLLAGLTGSGKSTLLLMLLLSMCLNTDPAELDLHLVDMKNEDLLPLRALPHVRSIAISPAAAAETIATFQCLKDARVASGHGPYVRTVLAIDELAQVAGIAGALDRLGDVMSIGRSKNVNVVAATQKPTAAVVGSIAKAMFPTRLVGRVADGDEAHTATGRKGTGAHLLPAYGGAFLRVEGGDPTRFQAYHLDAAGVRDLVRAVQTRWDKGAVTVTTPKAETIAPVPPTPATASAAAQPVDAIPAALPALFGEYLQVDGTLRRGGMAALLRALFGPVAATGGRAYQDQCAEAQHYIELWQAQIRKSSDATKIVKLQEWHSRKYPLEAFPEAKREVKLEVKGSVA